MDTYPEHERIYDEQGFKAGDDRFGFHSGAYVRPSSDNNGNKGKGSVSAKPTVGLHARADAATRRH